MILSPTTPDRGLGVCGCGQPAVLYGFCRACWSALPVLEPQNAPSCERREHRPVGPTHDPRLCGQCATEEYTR